MARPDLTDRLLSGVAAGFVGTLAMQVLRTGSAKALPATMPPIRKDPGEYMVEQAEHRLPRPVAERVPRPAETAAAKSLALGYGLTAGAVYALLRPRGGRPLTEGTVLGLATWAAGYAGWLPALDLMPPVSEQPAPEVLGPVVRHVLFGVVVVAAYDRIVD